MDGLRAHRPVAVLSVALLAAALLLGACQSGPAPRLSIAVDQPTALIDRPLHIQVTGVPGGATVDVQAEAVDEAGYDWTAAARFKGTAGGVVDLARQAPSGGSYAGVDGMGLFWSMRPRGAGEPEQTHLTLRFGHDLTVRLTADVGGHHVERRLTRETVGPAVQRQPVSDGRLVGTLFVPPGGGRHPAVLVLGGSEGGLREYTAALLASHGIPALALAYFGMPGSSLPATLESIPLEYFVRALDWLGRQPSVDAAHIGVVGDSRGGELALLLAATYPSRIQAVVGYVPSAVVNSGFSSDGIPVPAWTVNGQPIPFAPFDSSATRHDSHGDVERPGFERPLADATAIAPAVIPVERIAGPLLLVSGTDDQLWPSDHYADLVIARRRQHGVPYADVNLKYAGAGHFIGQPYVPTVTDVYAFGSTTLSVGGRPRAYAVADADSWPRVIAFLERAL